jgi:hypothetical protein
MGSLHVVGGKPDKPLTHIQFCIDGNSPVLFTISEVESSEKDKAPDPRAYRNDIEFVINPKVIHTQKRLRGLHLSPVDLMFRAESLWKEKKLTAEEIFLGIWHKFPLYNISDDGLNIHIGSMKKNFVRKGRMIIPHKLLGLALLNYVDSYLKKKTSSCYIKTKYIKDLSPGRRSYASRMLKECGYLELFGSSCWKRTSKTFNVKDFE